MTDKNVIFCQYCNNQFSPIRNSGKYCSDKCKQAAYRLRLKEKESYTLYTIGYEGRKLPDFIEILKANGIKHILDVRFSTKSQFKSEFSEENLKAVLSYVGIAYTSDKKLGVPINIQDLYKGGYMPISEFEKLYIERINKRDIGKLAKMIKVSGKTALMCYEKYATGNEMKVKGKEKFKINCHRSILAAALQGAEEFNEIINL